MLSPEAIKELKELYYRKTGKKLNSQESLDLGTKILVIMGATYKPIPGKEEVSIAIKNQRENIK